MSVFGGDPEIDEAGEHLWHWFWSAHAGRQAGMSGWQPLPATEWQAWQALTGHLVSTEEWEVLREMDGAFLRAVMDASKGDVPSASDVVRPDLTTAAFDAVFG